MSSQASRRAMLAVRAVKASATAAVAGTAIVLTLGGAIANPAGEPPSSADSARLAERAGLDARCVGAPGKAIVRNPRGETRAVSFEKGWRVYRGERPGTLVVVCPD